MTDSQAYASHYLKQLAGSASDNGHVEMSESAQSGGVGLGTSNNITSRYLIPASINARKSVVSVDVHGPRRNLANSSITNTRKRIVSRSGKRKKKRKKSNNVQRGGKRCAPKRRKKKRKNTRSPLYKGEGGGCNSKRKSGRFDNLSDNF